jgi:hypothetical protein
MSDSALRSLLMGVHIWLEVVERSRIKFGSRDWLGGPLLTLSD